jgi:transcriptional regulator with XRE-family HTH domain
MAKPEETIPGSWVKAARAAADKTQRQLWEAIGVDRTTVWRWEHGDVPIVKWRGILTTLGLPADWQPKGES